MLPRIYGENLFDDIFDDSFFTGHDPLFGKNGRNLMKTDVRETDDAKSYRLSIDLPGFKKDEITLDLKDGYLTVSAAKGLDKDEEDKKGQLILSHKKARLSKSWDRVNAALDNEEVVQGYVKCRTKGGMIVDVFGIEAFLPGSQIDVHPIRDYDVFVGKTMEFKVIKINQEFKNVVVSHKALIEAELEAQKKEIISKLEKGQVLEGTVKNITSYGVFVDLGGVDGLIHITDLSWGRVSNPHEVVELDQKINVVILDFDNEKKRIALGLKQLTPTIKAGQYEQMSFEFVAYDPATTPAKTVIVTNVLMLVVWI